jgi:hypothetical protein
LLGTALIVRYKQWRAECLVLAGVVATAAGTTGLGVAPSLAAVYPAQIVAGFGNAVELAGGSTLIQRRAPAAMLGRIAGASQTCVAIGFLAAYLGGGALVDATSPRAALVVGGVGTLSALAALRPVISTSPSSPPASSPAP